MRDLATIENPAIAVVKGFSNSRRKKVSATTVKDLATTENLATAAVKGYSSCKRLQQLK